MSGTLDFAERLQQRTKTFALSVLQLYRSLLAQKKVESSDVSPEVGDFGRGQLSRGMSIEIGEGIYLQN